MSDASTKAKADDTRRQFYKNLEKLLNLRFALSSLPSEEKRRFADKIEKVFRDGILSSSADELLDISRLDWGGKTPRQMLKDRK